jgi:subtilase family serine protease
MNVGKAILGQSEKMVSQIRFLVAGIIIIGMTAQNAAATGRQQLSGHMSKAAITAPLAGEPSPIETLDLAIGLPLRDPDGLKDLLKRIYDPRDPQHRHFLTPAEFTSRFGPTESDYRAVMDFARAKGLSVTGTHPNRALIEVRGTVADIEMAFHIRLRNYHRPDGSIFHAPDVEPSVDMDVPLSHIGGLENAVLPHPALPKKPKSPGPGNNPVPALGTTLSGSGPSSSYIGNDFCNAYVAGTTLTGSGQALASVQLNGFYPNDIADYESLAGIPSNVPLTVLCGSCTGVPYNQGNEIAEESLDIEMQVAMAPSADIYVYEGCYFNLDPVFMTLASPPVGIPLARQISCSYIGGINDSNILNALSEFAAQGQSYYQSTGDSGAYNSDPGDNRDLMYQTLVGGTELTMNGSGASYGSETTWNEENGWAGGGGILTNVPIPAIKREFP